MRKDFSLNENFTENGKEKLLLMIKKHKILLDLL